MNFLKSSLLSLTAISFLALTACGNSNAVNEQANPGAEVTQSIKAEHPVALPANDSKIQSVLEKAKKEGKAVFVVVTETGASETEKATTIAKGANELYKNATIVQLNRDDASNAQLVAEWRIAGAPLPLLLVVSPTGRLSGGMLLSQATAENIAALIPSPKLEEVYATIAAKKPALVVFTKKSLTDRDEVLKECKEAVTKLENNAVLIEVDMEDAKEVSFMKQLHIEKEGAASTTIVINTQGQVAGTSISVPDAEKLAVAATVAVKSGCGPGCGPTGCAK